MTAMVLDRSGVDYTAIDVTKSPAALEWMGERGYRSAPVVVVGDMAADDHTAWAGFRPERLEALAEEGGEGA